MAAISDNFNISDLLKDNFTRSVLMHREASANVYYCLTCKLLQANHVIGLYNHKDGMSQSYAQSIPVQTDKLVQLSCDEGLDCCRHATLQTYWSPKSWQKGKVISIASADNTFYTLTNKAKLFRILYGLQKPELWLDLAVSYALMISCYWFAMIASVAWFCNSRNLDRPGIEAVCIWNSNSWCSLHRIIAKNLTHRTS